MRTKLSRILLTLSTAFAIACPVASAVSPATIAEGRQLFERNWTAGNPLVGGDGLGPLFNGQSCVACHHQGGTGGGGDSRFNAHAIGIESMHFSNQQTTGGEIADFTKGIYLGFVRPDGSVINSAPIPHRHTHSSRFEEIRQSILGPTQTTFSEEGGAASAEESRFATDTPFQYSAKIGRNEITAKLRVFQRNTTPLFGAGLIDQISAETMKTQARMQERHPEISGRVSFLRNGTVGRFGWRANVSRLVQFVDRACANELGLETKRMRQPSDPTRPNYRNPAVDISDAQIEAMGDFLTSLPAPVELPPEDDDALAEISRGRDVFASVGCAACHVPDLGGARGIYSDLLLHDMGPKLYDYDAAEPHVVRTTLTHDERVVPGSAAISPTAYYGTPTPISRRQVFRGYSFASPKATTETSDYVSLAEGREFEPLIVDTGNLKFQARMREEVGLERRLKPSNTAQEWRTPPLWGLRDSGPYMHDGRAETVLGSIVMHGGESAGTRDRFLRLSLADRQALLAFLNTLVAPANVPQPANL